METSMHLSFAEMLKRCRRDTGLTQEELAERAGLSARAISDLERGINRRPYRSTVERLADALALSPAASEALTAARWRATTAAPSDSVSDTPPLVGRGRELALLERHLAGEGGPLLLFAGEPGIGKSRLLSEAGRRAATHGLRVLEGGCQRRGGQEAFAPLLGAIKRYLSTRTPAELRARLRGCAWLVRLLPELADGPIEPLPTWTAPPEQERRLMYEAVARFLVNVSGPERGTLLLLDDLQWAGSDALDLLATLVRLPASAHKDRGMGGEGILRVVAAYRDTDVQPQDPLSVTMADLAQAGLATHHAMEPLAVEEATQLLDGLLAGSPGQDESERVALRTRLLQRAGGVPFFLVSCAQGLHVQEQGARDSAVPWDVAQAVRQRVAALSKDARTVLGAAAVVGREVPPAILVAVAPQPEEEVLDALDAASRARLLMDEGHAYRFAHDVIREVIEADVGTARRLILHRRVAAAIEEIYANQLAEHYEVLAYHHLQGETWEQALAYLVKSGDKATASNAFQEALRLYDQALTLCDTLGASALATAVEVAQKRGTVLFDSGDCLGASADFARMRAAAAHLGDRHQEGMALAHRGMSLFFGHEFEAAEETLREALAVADDGFHDVGLLASANLADMLAVINRHAEAAALVPVATDLAPRVDDPFSQAWWSIYGCEILHWAGRYDDALALLERWRGAVETSHQIILLMWHKWEAAIACGGKGDYALALALLDEVLDICTRVGESLVAARAANTAGWIRGELQDYQRALELNTQSLEVASTIEFADTEVRNNALLNLGDCLVALGRPDEAEEHFQAVERVVRHPSSEDRWLLWRYAQHLFHSYGELWLARGELNKALSYADECLELAESSVSRKNIVKGRRLRAQVFLAQGSLSEAEVELERALAMAYEVGNPPQLWKTLMTVGELRQAQDRPGAAQQAYQEALSVVEQVAIGIRDEALHTTFLTSPYVQHIRQRATAATGARPNRSRKPGLHQASREGTQDHQGPPRTGD
jgi:predicted ATPase/DNA-binding XRE family transcriptional regulator